MKQFFFKKKRKVSIAPCSSDQIGCFYHIELFGKPCRGCIHTATTDQKDHKIDLPKSSPISSNTKA